MHNEACLSCGTDSYSKEEMESFLSEEAYIKQEQLLLFSLREDSESLMFYEDERDGFLKDISWKPIVTEEELRQEF